MLQTTKCAGLGHQQQSVQALCNEVYSGKDTPPRRMVNGGLDFRRFDQVLAVLSKHARMKMYNQDARVNVLGGARATEPAADAAMAAAIMCSYFDIQMPVDMVFIGEVDLGGVEAILSLEAILSKMSKSRFGGFHGSLGTAHAKGFDGTTCGKQKHEHNR
jgi:predicted ATP-dependent serine protease